MPKFHIYNTNKIFYVSVDRINYLFNKQDNSLYLNQYQKFKFEYNDNGYNYENENTDKLYKLNNYTNEIQIEIQNIINQLSLENNLNEWIYIDFITNNKDLEFHCNFHEFFLIN